MSLEITIFDLTTDFWGKEAWCLTPKCFFFSFQKNSAMATLGLKEMGKLLWEGRKKVLPSWLSQFSFAFRSFFGRIEETINCFRDLLTFNENFMKDTLKYCSICEFNLFWDKFHFFVAVVPRPHSYFLWPNLKRLLNREGKVVGQNNLIHTRFEF